MKKFVAITAVLFLLASLSFSGQSHAQDTAIPEEVKRQIEILQSGTTKEKINAARTLGKIGSEAVPAAVYLIELLDSPKKYRSPLDKILNVVTIVGKFGDKVSIESQHALIKIGGPAVGPLSEALLNDSRSRVRYNAAIALGDIKDAGSIDTLITALQKDVDYQVRMYSAEALGEMAEKWSIELLDNAVTALMEALKDNDQNVRQKAAAALGKIKSMRSVPALIEALQTYGKDSNAAPALSKISLQHLGNDPQKWQKWYDSNKQD